jgi:hypothetical protein
MPSWRFERPSWYWSWFLEHHRIKPLSIASIACFFCTDIIRKYAKGKKVNCMTYLRPLPCHSYSKSCLGNIQRLRPVILWLTYHAHSDWINCHKRPWSTQRISVSSDGYCRVPIPPSWYVIGSSEELCDRNVWWRISHILEAWCLSRSHILQNVGI